MFRLTYSASASSSYLMIVIRIFFIIIFLGSNLFQFATTKSGYDNCGYSSATNGEIPCGWVTLQYPFWSMVEKEQQNYCGYPGFGVICNPVDGETILNISNQFYYVTNASQYKQLTIVDTHFFRQDCPTPHTNFTTNQNFESHSLFRLEGKDYNTQLTFFPECRTPPPQTRNVTTLNMTGSNSIKCRLPYSQKTNSYGFLDFNLNKSERKSLAGWSQNSCSVSVIVPLQNLGYTHGYENLIIFPDILQSGFKIRWVTPIECQKCEKSGGFCSYNEIESTYSCWCGEGHPIRNGEDRKGYYCSWDNDTLPADTLLADTLRANTSMHNKILIIGICSGFGGLASLMILLLFVYRNNQ